MKRLPKTHSWPSLRRRQYLTASAGKVGGVGHHDDDGVALDVVEAEGDRPAEAVWPVF
jgi:hypothetical protein